VHNSGACGISATGGLEALFYAEKWLFRIAASRGRLATMRDSLKSTGEPIRVEYVPRPGLGRLAIVNFLLNLITLTIYRFWAKTNVRRHIWSCVHINGQPLEYTGRGIEIFFGFLIVLGLFVLPFTLAIAFVGIAWGPLHPALIGLQVLFILLIYVLWGAALYRARRYQLSRTLWRGIRGTLVGSSMIYSLTYFGSLMARGMSLGWSTPVLNTVLQEQIIGDMRLGDLAFKFKGRAGPLYPTYALCWFLSLVAIVVFIFLFGAEVAALFGPEVQKVFDEIGKPDAEPTLEQIWTAGTVIAVLAVSFIAMFLVIPMLWAIYSAKELSTFANYTRAGNATFRLNATTGSLISLVIVNLLILIFTLGIGRPFIQQRLIRYMCDRMEVIGTIDVDRIAQSQATMDRTGEGLADAFDLGVV
jgi:uncharacterized membrane protein YjgN (DUF898 family)